MSPNSRTPRPAGVVRAARSTVREDELLEAQRRDPRRQRRRVRAPAPPARARAAPAPSGPRQRAARVADRGEQRVVLQPRIRLAPRAQNATASARVARAGRGEARGGRVQRPLAALPAGAHRIQLAVVEQATVVQPVQADQARVAGVDRDGVVGRAVGVRRPERQHLPDRAAGRRRGSRRNGGQRRPGRRSRTGAGQRRWGAAARRRAARSNRCAAHVGLAAGGASRRRARACRCPARTLSRQVGRRLHAEHLVEVGQMQADTAGRNRSPSAAGL